MNYEKETVVRTSLVVVRSQIVCTFAEEVFIEMLVHYQFHLQILSP